MKIKKKKWFESHVYSYLKVWACGQKVPFYVKFSFCSVPCTILTQKVWTGGQVMKILSISLFLSTLYPSKFWQKRWTGGQALKFFWKIIQPCMFYCSNVWTIMCLSISCFLYAMYPSQCWKKVWTGGQVIKVLKKCSNLFYCFLKFEKK